MEEQERATLEQVVERAKSYSQQPRFTNEVTVYAALSNWVQKMKELEQPDYKSDSRKRDAWLREFVLLEPHWLGVLQQTTMIDANRGWQMIGGRNQVNRYTTMMHNANDGDGWRAFAKFASRSFREADINTIVELGREGSNGPLRAIYNVDPTRCKLTGKVRTPLTYYPLGSKAQDWRRNDYFRVASFPSTDERYHGLSYCASSMAVEIVKLLYGVLMHDQEKVGARMPKGLLHLQGVDEEQWTDMLEAREHDLDAKARSFFGGVFVLATAGVEQTAVNLIALSQLPDNFDRQTFINQCLYAYALIVGYAPGEFWPVQFGALGRGKEEETQHMRATTKGGLDFTLTLQEQLQMELPDTLHFEFEQRDEAGELLQAQVSQAWVDVANSLYAAPDQFNPGLLSKEQAMTLLVEHGIIPSEWTEQEEEETATDTEDAETRILDIPAVRRACELYCDEPIVRYTYRWDAFADTMRTKEVIIWESGAEALRPRLWRSFKQRQDESEVLFEDDDVVITQADVDRAIEDGGRRLGLDFEGLLVAQEATEEP